MFEFLFKYPWAVYQRGSFLFAREWPAWMLLAGMAAAACLVAWLAWRQRRRFGRAGRVAVLGGLQFTLLCLLLAMLWQPALSVPTLQPNQSVIAVLVDTSRSMAIAEDGLPRIERARRLLEGGLLESLGKRYPVRIYRAGDGLDRVADLKPLAADGAASRLGESLLRATGEAATLPVGAIVLLSDGAENAGGIGLETAAAIRRSRIPVYTVGFGREQIERDVEITEASLPARALPGSRLTAAVTFRQAGFGGQRARLEVRDGDKLLASREVALPSDGGSARELLTFTAGQAGAHAYRIALEPLEGEISRENNSLNRLVVVEDRRPRILYYEGEPRWEMKFIRRALELDEQVHLVSILRTTQNKIYRQGVAHPKELEEGFPQAVDELFGFSAVILGTVEASSFSTAQLALLREFVDRRGGGLLFLGGRVSLSDGGWNRGELAELLPVVLPERKNTFRRDPATVEIGPAGRDSDITRLEDQPEKNAARWKSMPYLADHQDAGQAKPGAAVLLEARPAPRGSLPLLAVHNYGRGRVAVFATGGSWRWQMGQDSKDMSHETFWRQLGRWIVNHAQGRVAAYTPRAVLSGERRAALLAEVRDRNYLPAPGATVEATVIGPGGLTDVAVLEPAADSPGAYRADYQAETPGSYLVEVVARRGDDELGRDVFTFLREDGVAENFRTEQNRDLLERLAAETGGRYYPERGASRLAEEIDYSAAGIAVRETRDIWDMPALFLLAAALKAAEWLLRRKWGAV
jgi:uncharacterized membrane protein